MSKSRTASLSCATLVFLVAGFDPPELMAADNSKKPVDVITICYNVQQVCQDACDKAEYTQAQYVQCENKCNSYLDDCLGNQASQGNAGVSKEEALKKKRKKKYVPTN